MAKRYWLRKAEVAQKLGVSVRTVERLVKGGKLTRARTKGHALMGIDRGSVARLVRETRKS